MPQKGIELPVNSVIIIALGIFVLLMITFFFGKSGSELDKTQLNTAFNQGCSQLSTNYNCDHERVNEISTTLVVDGQAKTLLDVCRMSFNNPSMSEFKCKKACQVCPNRVSDGYPCEDDTDCTTALTSNWKCKLCGVIVEGTCSQQICTLKEGITDCRFPTDAEKNNCINSHTNGKGCLAGDTSKYCYLTSVSAVHE